MVSSKRVKLTLSGGAPWGFRLTGGGALPLTINKIRKKSRAHVQGLREGDAVISINGVPIHDRSQDEALELVEASGDSLTLEIFRGDTDEVVHDKPKQPIHVPFTGNASGGQLRLLTTGDDGVSPGEVVLIPSMHSVTSGSLNTAEHGRGLTSRAAVNVRVISVDSSPGRTRVLNDSAGRDRSPGTSARGGHPDVHFASSAPTVAAKPFFVSQSSESPPPNPNQFPQQPPNVSPHPPPAPQPPSGSHPQQVLQASTASTVSQLPPVGPRLPGVTSAVSSSVFDDGQSRREITREQHFQRSDDGSKTSVVVKETTTTTTKRPSFVKGQASAFNSVQPIDAGQNVRKTTATTTSRKSTTSIVNQKGPTPFSALNSPSILQSQFQPSLATPAYVIGSTTETPLFKPTKFVPSSGKKEIQGLYSPTSPVPDFSAYGGFRDGKENMAPQPLFQVKNIVSDKAKSSAKDVWRPNVWLPDQQPTSAQEETQVATPKDDVPVFMSQSRPGYSLVEKQKRKLLASQTSRNEYIDPASYGRQNQPDIHGHHKHERLHVFAPPVEIHADEDDDDHSSLDSFGQKRKKNLYSDSAFYDTPGKNYPTINEQMKLCKIIAQSLTSAANKRARGAKMFMKRKRKSSKWIHEGQSELSSSTGDVANLHELDSELSPEDGGNKPLLYFKIPTLKNRIGSEGKNTKMALSQEEFEKLRLSAKKCDHAALPPDTCFDIVADLKAHKGRGGRLFERRKQRSDKFVIDETNAKFPLPQGRRDNDQSPHTHPTAWEVAMKHGAKVEHPPTAPLPSVRTSLKSDDSPFMLKGKNFNRTAKGWGGGGEYPVAEELHHISSPGDFGPPQGAHLQNEQNYREKVKIWQESGEPSFPTSPAQDWSQDLHTARKQGYQKPTRQDKRARGWPEQRQNNYQTPRPKSWHPQSFDNQTLRDSENFALSPVDYSPSAGYPSVAYKQPIIPGTDL